MEYEHRSGIITVTLNERCSDFAMQEVKKNVKRSFEHESSVCILDFKKCTSLDSRALGQLVCLTHDSKLQNRSIVIKNLTEPLVSFFRDTGIDTLFDIDSSNGMQKAVVDLFDPAGEIRLSIVSEDVAGVYILRLQGVMNHPAGSRFFKQKILVAMALYTRMLIDLEELTYFDSISVSVLLLMHRLLKESGGCMRLCGANYVVSDLFETLGIKNVMKVFETQTEALAEWS